MGIWVSIQSVRPVLLMVSLVWECVGGGLSVWKLEALSLLNIIRLKLPISFISVPEGNDEIA